MSGNIKDYATGIVVTAPSPATSGTTLTVQTGEGSRMPATPFYATAHPAFEMPTLDNAEKLQVTNVTGDTLTIVRAQGDTTAKTIEAGWRISNSLFESNIPTALSELTNDVGFITEETDPVFTAWDKDHGDLSNIGSNTHANIDTKLASLLNEREITKESTGFTNPDNITVTYNSTTRKVTLTGTFEAYYKGEKITALVNGWESQAHADVNGIYFLRYCIDDGGFAFDTDPWEFDCLQIAYVQYNGHKFGIRETHGFMPWTTHKELHSVVGTYKVSGGEIPSASYVLSSTTAANRRPDVNATVTQDEDLATTIAALTSKTYTLRYLSGNTPTREFTTGASDIISLNGNIPYYNQNVGGTWQQTPMSNNEYGAIFVVAIPTSADAGSQAYRYLFVQPQQVGTLSEIQALTPNDLVHGISSMLVSEFVFIGKIIIKVSGSNWTLESVEALSGTRLSQVSSVAGNYLSTVSHDTTLTGSGTAIDPLVVANPVAPQTNGFTITAGTTPKTLTVANTASVSGTNTGDQDLSGYATLTTSQTLTNKVITNVATSAPATPVEGMLWWDTDDTSNPGGDLVTDHINEVTAGHGVTVDGLTIKDGALINPYKFHAYSNSANQTIGASYTATVITLNQELFDTNGNFNTGTYTYTVPTTGYYFVSGSGRFSSTSAASSEIGVAVYKNGASLIGAFGTAYANGQYDSLNASAIVYLASGDTLDLRIYTSGGGTHYNNFSSQVYLSGFLVSK